MSTVPGWLFETAYEHESQNAAAGRSEIERVYEVPVAKRAVQCPIDTHCHPNDRDRPPDLSSGSNIHVNWVTKLGKWLCFNMHVYLAKPIHITNLTSRNSFSKLLPLSWSVSVLRLVLSVGPCRSRLGKHGGVRKARSSIPITIEHLSKWHPVSWKNFPASLQWQGQKALCSQHLARAFRDENETKFSEHEVGPNIRRWNTLIRDSVDLRLECPKIFSKFWLVVSASCPKF